MNESTQHHMRGQLLHRLLVTASSLTLLAGFAQAAAAENEGPTIWIEVGGGLEQIDANETEWLPPNLTPPISNPQPAPFGKLPAIGFDSDLKLSFTPNESDWVYSASIRYGRAQRGPKNSHDQSYNIQGYYTYFDHQPVDFLTNYDFTDAARQSQTTHAILDFMAGKDVGLGAFGGGKSVFSAGIRVVQLNERAEGHLTAFLSAPVKYASGEVAHKAQLLVSRSFNGLGPSVAWDASAPLFGSSGGFSLDWGANAAVLFGRQKANVLLRTKDTQYSRSYNGLHSDVLSQSTQAPTRRKMVVVPNVGGFAGLSWRLPNAKVSLGYRADFFFGAIDGGLATSRKDTRGFYGPFATVAIGIGG